MRRIHTAPHAQGGEALAAEVRVTFDDGSMLAQRVATALGRGPESPLPLAALNAKFADCAGRALPPAQVAAAQRLLLQLDEAASLRAVLAALATPAIR